MQLLHALRNATMTLAGQIEDSKLFEHMGDRGEYREAIIERFLRPFLPPQYGLGSGMAFSAEGRSSCALDVVIYDAIFSPVLFRTAANSIYPCESVYGVIEVKSFLDRGELATSVENIASLKRLDRAPASDFQVLPYRALTMGQGLSMDTGQDLGNPYVGVVFAYDSCSLPTICQHLAASSQSDQYPRAHLPDFLCCLKKGYFISRGRQVSDGQINLGLDKDPDSYYGMEIGDDTLPLLFLMINTTLGRIALRGMNQAPYVNSILQALRDEGVTILQFPG